MSERIITALPNLYKTSGEDCSYFCVADVARRIATDPHLKNRAAAVRSVFSKNGKKCPEYAKAKKQLPVVMFAGRFSAATNVGFKEHSGLMILDFDCLSPEQLAKLLRAMVGDPHTVLVMVSPSGVGLKWLVAVEATDEVTHKACFRVACDYASRMFGVEPDPAGADISRKCILAHDPRVEVREPTESFAPHPRHLEPEREKTAVTADNQTIRQSDNQTYMSQAALPVLSESDKPWVLKQWDSYLPRAKHHTNRPVFDAARVCRNIELKYRLRPKSLHHKDMAVLFEWWWGVVNPEFMTNSKADYRAEFLAASGNADSALGETPIKTAWEMSRHLPPPPEAYELFPDEGAEHQHRIFSVAHLLSRLFHGGTILLLVNELVKLAIEEGIEKLKNPNQVNRIIRAMQPTYLWKQKNFEFNVSDPRKRKGSEFVYLGRAYSDGELHEFHAARLRSLAA